MKKLKVIIRVPNGWYSKYVDNMFYVYEEDENGDYYYLLEDYNDGKYNPNGRRVINKSHCDVIEDKQGFTLKYLKTGMVVENRVGERGIILLNTPDGDVIGGVGDNKLWGPLDNFNEDLTSSFGLSDIVKVYKPNSNMNMVSGTNSELLWSRTLEISIEDIAEKFGVDEDNIIIKGYKKYHN